MIDDREAGIGKPKGDPGARNRSAGGSGAGSPRCAPPSRGQDGRGSAHETMLTVIPASAMSHHRQENMSLRSIWRDLHQQGPADAMTKVRGGTGGGDPQHGPAGVAQARGNSPARASPSQQDPGARRSACSRVRSESGIAIVPTMSMWRKRIEADPSS